MIKSDARMRIRLASWRILLSALVVSVLTHVLLIGSLPDFETTPIAPPAPLVARLTPTPAAPPKAATPPPPAPRRKPPPAAPQVIVQAPVRSIAPPLPPIESPVPATSPATPVPAAPPAAVAPPATPAPPVPSAPPAPPLAGAPEPAPAAPPPEPAPAVQVEPAPAPRLPASTPPASVRLNYSVIATDVRTEPAKQTFGSGRVTWSHHDGRYVIDLQAGIDLLFLSLTVLASHSQGTVDVNGLAPLRYTEAPRNRPVVATNFNRNPDSALFNTITFSAATAKHPLPPAAQDRLSVIFQLSGLLRANAEFQEAGKEIKVFVAGVRGDAETWSFSVKGAETIEAAGTTFRTLRLQRLSHPDNNDRALDLWFALDRETWPVQIRYTENNGNRIDLQLTGIEPGN